MYKFSILVISQSVNISITIVNGIRVDDRKLYKSFSEIIFTQSCELNMLQVCSEKLRWSAAPTGPLFLNVTCVLDARKLTKYRLFTLLHLTI